MIHIVIGTKAQLVKMAPIMLILQQNNTPYNFIFTGQHQETIDNLRENFSLKIPDITLHKGKDIVSYTSMLAWVIKISIKTLFYRKKIFNGDNSKHGIVLVHGDTFSTLLGAIMGKMSGFTVAHIESGLRSFNIWHPFPEELTRIMTFRIASIYFCPGQWAVDNLKKYNGKKINTQYNTLLDSLGYALTEKTHSVNIPTDKYCIVTTHRFENLCSSAKLRQIISLIEIAARHMKVIFILHPVTERKLKRYHLLARLKDNSQIELHPRYDYFNFIYLINSAEFVISDGGSNQEECFYMGKPCLLLRKTTERNEGLGINTVISDFDEEVISLFCNNYKCYTSHLLTNTTSPSRQIVNSITEWQ